MRSFTTREWSFGLVFVVTLAWGVWNYRHLFGRSESAQLQPEASTAGLQTVDSQGSATTASLAVPAYTSRPEWGLDPFHRPWRRAAPVATAAKTGHR